MTERLDELDKEEMRDLSKAMNPKLTDEQFDLDWAEFVELKKRKSQQ